MFDLTERRCAAGTPLTGIEQASAWKAFARGRKSCMIRSNLGASAPPPKPMDVHVVRHPLVEDVLAALRDPAPRATSSGSLPAG